MRKNLLARALALFMSLSLLSTSAFAAVAFDTNVHVGGSGELLSHEETNDAGDTFDSYDYYLENDVNLDQTLVIKDGVNASIDLNGHDLSLNKNLEVDTENATVTAPDDAKVGSVIKVTGEGTSLTVTDGSDDATGTISGGYDPGAKPAGFGGGITVDGNASLDLQGGTITNNVAANGGGVYVGSGSVTMSSDATIDGNLATLSGGGVFLNTEGAQQRGEQSSFTMNGGFITNNTASGTDANGNIVGGGGGIATYRYNESERDYTALTINGGTITGNRAEVDGAGIYVRNDAAIINNATISNNVSGAILGDGTKATHGGGIYVYGDKSVVDINNSSISGNSATGNGNGGGIYAFEGVNVNVSGGSISGNSATYGGGIADFTSTINLSGGLSIWNNTAAANGGGIYIQNSTATLTVDDTSISGNSAVNGGGIYASTQTSVSMTGGNITENTANERGGGIYAANSTVDVTGTNILNNIASTLWGGGVYAGGTNAQVTLTNNIISGNKAMLSVGGGVGVYNSTVTMTGNTISNNSATQGGGVYVQGSTANVTMSSGSITENTANYGGGVFNSTNSTFTMTGGTLYINSASVFADDVYAASSATTTLVSASSMNAVGADGKPITGWYVDNSSRYGYGSNPYSLKDGALLESGYAGVLNLKAAHDQYFSVTDGNGSELANVEKGTVLDLTTLDDPTLDGYEFIGWVLGDAIVDSVTVTEEITLGSMWTHVDHDTVTVRENEVPAQIGVEGSYDVVTYCTVCGEVISRETVTTPALEEPTDPELPSEPTDPELPTIPVDPTDPELPTTPDDVVTIPDPDVPMAGMPGGADELSIEDEAVPLAGIVSLAELLEELRQYEEVDGIELPEDFKFIDHEYAQAIYWALAEGLVADTEEEPLDPDEILTVGLLQKVLDNFVAIYKDLEDFDVTVEGEADEMVMDLGDRLAAFYAELELAE